MPLITDYNFAENFAGDEIYQQLLDAHQNLTSEQSHEFNIRLLLILMNHIGDNDVLAEAIKSAG